MSQEVIISTISCAATIISLGIAIIALFQSNKQTKLSNKQNLFNDRVNIYLIFKGLIQLYKENQDTIEKEKNDDLYLSSEYVLGDLVNNAYLEIMAGVIGKTLQQPYQKDFLTKIEEIKNVAEKTKFIYEKDVNNYIYNFIVAYEELLMQLYKYSVLIYRMREMEKQIPNKEGIREIAKSAKEIEHRNKLFDKFNNLKKAYRDIEENQIIEKMEKMIQL